MTAEHKDTPLHEAVRYNDTEDVRKALRAGYDPNQIGLYQWSPLHEAANNGDVDIVRLLLRFKGDPNVRDVLRGCTAVHYACKGNHYDCLQLLISAGGRHDIINNDGESCLDVAHEDCEDLLQQQRKFDTISSSSSPLTSPDSEKKCTTTSELDDLNKSISTGQGSYSDGSDVFDINSIDSSPVSSEINFNRTWSMTSQLRKRELALGHIELSFEYNSKKSSLKIRVWRVYDLLMPPAEQSMVNGIYVKSYLLPDNKKDTKRRTEELSVYKHENTETKKKEAGKRRDSSNLTHSTFTPRSFIFEKPLEYTKITEDVVKQKYVELHVTITQRYTRRSFTIATWNMPLKVATRKLVRENFQLKASLGVSFPDNMRVYGANELSGHGNIRNAYSNPNIRYPSLNSLFPGEPSERASSDIDLKQVVTHTHERPSSFILTLPEEDDDEVNTGLDQISVSVEKSEDSMKVSIPDVEKVQHIVPEIKVLNVTSRSKQTSRRSRYSSTDSESDLDNILKKTDKREKDPSKAEKGVSRSVSKASSEKGLKPNQHSRLPNFSSLNESKNNSPKRSKSKQPQSPDSRPATPEWDYFMEPLTISMVSPELLDDDFDLCLLEPHEPVLPTPTSMHVPTKQQSFGFNRNASVLSGDKNREKASLKYEDKGGTQAVSSQPPQIKQVLEKQRRRSSAKPVLPITEL